MCSSFNSFHGVFVERYEMPDLLTAHLIQLLAAKDKQDKHPDPLTVKNPQRVAVPLPKKRIPEKPSLVSFPFLLANTLRMHPDAVNAEDVKLTSIKLQKFKDVSKGVVTKTRTDLPGYKTPHVYQQVIRCTPADYKGKISECPGIVANCSCPRDLYTWNYARWAKYGAVLNALRQPPEVTNPKMLIGWCKHGLVALRAIKRRGL